MNYEKLVLKDSLFRVIRKTTGSVFLDWFFFSFNLKLPHGKRWQFGRMEIHFC